MKDFYKTMYDEITAELKKVRAKVMNLIEKPITPTAEGIVAHTQLFKLFGYLRKAQKVANDGVVYELNKEHKAARAKREAVDTPF